MPTSTLFLTTTFIRDQSGRFLLGLWNRLRERLSGEFDCLVIDSASPIPLPLPGFERGVLEGEDHVPTVLGPKTIWSFDRNIGPPPNRMDGSPDSFIRAFKKGVEIAYASGYARVFFVISDMLLMRPAAPIIDRCERHNIRAATPWDCYYQWCETDIICADVPRLAVAMIPIDWRSPPKSFWERTFEAIAGDELFILPLRGARDDHHKLTSGNLDKFFPHGVDYLTHCHDFGAYRALLARHGLEDLWDG
jgi:hypothetical protein